MAKIPNAGMNPSRQKAYQTATEEAAKKEEFAPRLSMRPGVNIVMAIPASAESDSPLPYRYVQVHHNPFHMCLRNEPYEDKDGNLIQDKKFSNCPRCIGAWNAMIDEGIAKADSVEKDPSLKARRDLLRSNLSSVQMLWQLVDMTPFFKFEKTRAGFTVSVDPERMALMDQYADVVSGKSDGKGLPEDMVASAKAGASVLKLSQTNGEKLSSAYYKRYAKLKNKDPLVDPDNNLMQIDLTPSGKTMKTKKGEVIIYDWSVDFVEADALEGFEISQKLLDALLAASVDLYNMKEEDSTFEALSRAFKRADSEDTLLDWLDKQKWTLGPAVEQNDEDEDHSAPVDAPSMGKRQSSGLGGNLMGRVNELAEQNRNRSIDDDEIPF